MFNYFTATLSLFQLINLSFMFVECLIPWILVWTLRFKVLLLNRREALCIQKVYSLFGCPCVAFPNRESATHEAVPSSFEMWNCKGCPSECLELFDDE